MYRTQHQVGPIQREPAPGRLRLAQRRWGGRGQRVGRMDREIHDKATETAQLFTPGTRQPCYPPVACKDPGRKSRQLREFIDGQTRIPGDLAALMF